LAPEGRFEPETLCSVAGWSSSGFGCAGSAGGGSGSGAASVGACGVLVCAERRSTLAANASIWPIASLAQTPEASPNAARTKMLVDAVPSV